NIIGANGQDDDESGGVAYDPVLKRIYYATPNHDGTLPLVHVFDVPSATGVVPPPPGGGGPAGAGKRVFWPSRGEEAVVACAETATVFDRDGRDVASLNSDGVSVHWNGRHRNGELEPAGTYTIRCGTARMKAVIVK